MQTPQVVITVGQRRFAATARRLPPEEAERSVLAYVRQHPVAVRVLPRLLGYRVDGTEADFHALARLAMVVAFHPVPPTQPHESV